MIKVLRLIFFFIYYPSIWYQKNRYEKRMDERKKQAFIKAVKMQKTKSSPVFVSKMGDEFFIGTCLMLKNTELLARKKGLDWSWIKNKVKP